MAFNFPNSPSNGQTYVPVGGPTFTWDGTAWQALSQGMPVTVYVSDTAPSNPSPGQLWWESDSGNLFISYIDADSTQWVQVNGTPAGYQTAQARSRITNGAMQVSQENLSSPGTTGSYYAVDEWYTLTTGTGVPTSKREPSLTPNGSTNRYRITITTADATLTTTDRLGIVQQIEGIRVCDFDYGLPSARQSILRFGWKSPAGTYSVGLLNDATDRSYVMNFTISAAQANIDTVQTFTIPGDTTGAWVTGTTGAGLIVNIMIACGPSYTTPTANTWQTGAFRGTTANTNGYATAGAVYELFDVGLYLDPDRTGAPPKWTMPDYPAELLSCQRYWYKPNGRIVAGGWGGANGTAITHNILFPAVMRATPAATITQGTPTNSAGLQVSFTYTTHAEMRATASAAGNTSGIGDPVIFNARL